VKTLLGGMNVLDTLVHDYLKQSSYAELNTVDGSKGLCDSVAVSLKKYLSTKGIDSTVIEGINYLPELHESAHEDWKSFKGKDQKFLAHVVLKVEDTIIDLTGAQFNINNATRMIYPFSIFKKEWKQIKTPKYLNQ
jgi:hypothetical protein